MYAYLQGKIVSKTAAQIVLDVGGVGYEINISLHTFSALQNVDTCKLYIYFQVKEDAHTLFGFFEQEEKEMFMLLISVSGVGAATARMMLSGLKPVDVANAILTNNVKVIESVKGIGKKTAERLVLELKDKVGGKFNASPQQWNKQENTMEKDAINALFALGIAQKQAELAVKKVITDTPDISKLEDLIKKALKAI
jgi:holliday junction DNA helicase RuvA